MIKKTLKIIFFGILLFMTLGCPSPVSTIDPDESDPTSETTPVKGDIVKYFWGSWVRMDGANEEWYISDSKVIMQDSDYTASASTDTTISISGYTLTKQTSNMVSVQPSTGLEFYLFRKSGATAQITGGVLGSSASLASMRNLGGLGGIDVIIGNLNNPSDETETTTDSDGNITVDEVILGDEYTITIGGVTYTVTPVFDGENIGFITLNNADQNFKVSYRLTGSTHGYYFAGNSYSLTIRITNVGSADMLSADYEITEPAGLSLSGNSLQNILGTVQAEGGVKELSFSVSADMFSEEYRDFNIPISITGVDGTQWMDSIGLRFFRETMSINIRSETDEVQGIAISPDNHAFSFQTSGRSGSIVLPAWDEPVVLALTGADYSSETKYSLMVNEIPSDNGSSLTSASFNEPNNDESQSTAILSGVETLGYLGVYDLDFYQVYNAETTTFPIFNCYSATNDTTPTWSWNAVNSAVGYRYSHDETNWTSTLGLSFTPSSALSDGSYTLYVQAQDILGDWSESGSWTIDVDTIAPSTPELSGTTPTTDTTPTWSWTGSIDSVEYRYSFTDGADWVLTSETSYTPETDLDEGSYTLYVQACDLAGNWSASGNLSIEIIILDSPTVSGAIYTNDNTPTWIWNSPIGTEYRYSFTEGTNWNTILSTSYTPETNLSDGVYTLYVQVKDSLGEWSASGSFSTIVDTIPPTLPTLTSNSPTSDNTPTWSWITGTDIEESRFSFTDGSDWIYTTLNNYTPSTSLSDGDYTLYVQIKDFAGNWSLSDSCTVTVDTEAPDSPSINSVTPTSDPTPTISWIDQTDVLLYRYQIDSEGWVEISESSVTILNELSVGTHSFFLQGRDQVGNWSLSSSISFVILPEIPTVSGTTPINDSTPTWYWNNPIGAVEYRYSFTDGVDWINTVNTNFTPSVELSEGEYTLYVQAKDDLGNWTSSGSFTITVEFYVSSVAVGNNHTLILKTDGTLWGTGYNLYGELGDGTTELRSTPVQIMTDVSAISAGDYHSLILKTDGTLWATGHNDSGQLGDGTHVDKSIPVPIMTDVSAIDAGGNHSMILKTDGTLWATGDNASGKLGDGTDFDQTTPVYVMSDVSSVSAGSTHTLVIKNDGTLWAFGNNQYGQFGNGSTFSSNIPVQIMSNISLVSAGQSFSMILKSDNTLWATGDNSWGKLGDGTLFDTSSPVQIMTDVLTVSAGDGNVLIVKNDGTLWGAGKNGYGELGDGTEIQRSTPIYIMSDVISAYVENQHTMIIKTDTTLWSTGRNLEGQLGDGTQVSVNTPIQIIP